MSIASATLSNSACPTSLAVSILGKARKTQVTDPLTQSNIRCLRIIAAIIDSAENSDAHLAIRGERIPFLPAATSDAAI